MRYAPMIGRCWRKSYTVAYSVRKRLTSPLARLYLRLWGVEFGAGLRIYSMPLCRRHPQATIRIGRDVRITNRLQENLAGVPNRTVLSAERPGSSIVIGDQVGLSGVILYCTREIVIEDYAQLGAGARVYDTDFHPVDAVARREKSGTGVSSAPVRICRDAWVGANAIILKGVTIGARSVVGAGAVVTKDVPPDTIVAGVPARVVGRIESQA